MHKTKRDAKRIIHAYAHHLRHIPAHVLPVIAKGMARFYNLPQKAMLKGMASYIRVHHNQGESNA
jgi:hypothetical protein